MSNSPTIHEIKYQCRMINKLIIAEKLEDVDKIRLTQKKSDLIDDFMETIEEIDDQHENVYIVKSQVIFYNRLVDYLHKNQSEEARRSMYLDFHLEPSPPVKEKADIISIPLKVRCKQCGEDPMVECNVNEDSGIEIIVAPCNCALDAKISQLEKKLKAVLHGHSEGD